ncbi:hypothetical protein GQ54DRAFT_302136 [Martensiomyces pterosporus]|nr:hypothetical protein GQ54DRAFT_302136 [Martensiomyces pterosporus]
MTCCIKPVAKRGRWSKEEEEQLRHLVDICVKGQLSPEIVLQRHQKGTQSRPSSVDNINAAKFEMYGRFADALKKDNSSRLNSQGDSTAGAIVWPLISTYMGVRTASQCRLKWYYMQKNSSSDDGCEFYKGPWTRDEDATLYRLYRMNPGRWLWIHQGLPRRRKLISVKARYVTYVGRYVEMLRRCRPPGWDPMDDQFEEVHMRCEILAWHRGQLEGYRDSDPYESPYDLDLTGYSKWIKDTAS